MLVATLYTIHRHSVKVTHDVPLVQMAYVAKMEELLILSTCLGLRGVDVQSVQLARSDSA